MNAPHSFKTALAFENVRVRYGTRRALDDVTHDFAPGCVTGLAGPNGAGKTTLLRTALKLLKPENGSIRLMDRPLGEWSDDARAKTIAYLPQSTETEWPMIARRVVALGRMPHRAFARPARADDAIIADALERCDASALADRRMDELSSGERARVLLARALATKAPVLMVDEPAAHLDPAHQLQLMTLLRAEAARGTAVIVTLHDLALASRYCDDLVLLKEGRIASSGPPDAALSDAALSEVFGVAAMRVRDATGNRLFVVTPIQ
jgi:iron complex transport system ATP-binding protein